MGSGRRTYSHAALLTVLEELDLGASVAEQDNLLENARVETSAFSELLNDKVDLITGTKGSGKSALYRIVVDFLPDYLLAHRKVVVAHGVQRTGDSVFHAFTNAFDKMTEDDFVDFWCVYFVSLARDHFVRGSRYQHDLAQCAGEVARFNAACRRARIPAFEGQPSLRSVISWAIDVVRQWSPKLKYRPPGDAGEFEVDLFGGVPEGANSRASKQEESLPRYVEEVRASLEPVLTRANLSLWLMVDRLDELFLRRSPTETRALRGLLRTLRIFTSPVIRIKVFLRDDIFAQVTKENGFAGLTHVTARQADPLRWSEDQILTMVTMRLFANKHLAGTLGIESARLEASEAYRREAFYMVFPEKVVPRANQSATLRWIYNHAKDGNGVVTPRDVILLLTRAKQHQFDICSADSSGRSDYVIGPAAIRYGLAELSQTKTEKYLLAEFPAIRDAIDKLRGGKAELSERHLQGLFGVAWKATTEELISAGVLAVERAGDGTASYKIPFVYRAGLGVTQGTVR
jgi:hypothetical protein